MDGTLVGKALGEQYGVLKYHLLSKSRFGFQHNSFMKENCACYDLQRCLGIET